MTQEPVNLHLFQDVFFSNAVERCTKECVAYYKERLISIYVWGSVHRGEAHRGISDLDLVVYASDVKTSDRDWVNSTNARLKSEFPEFETGMLSPPHDSANAPRNMALTEDENTTIRNKAWAYRLIYDSTLVFGKDLTRDLKIEPPDRVWAQMAFESTLSLARYAAGLQTENETDFDLPDEPSLRMRKLARLAVLGGAYLLMAQGQFQSYRGIDVLPPLISNYPEWAGFLDHTRNSYVVPKTITSARLHEYSSNVVSWLMWIHPQLD